MNNKLEIILTEDKFFEPVKTYADYEIESICRYYLDKLACGDPRYIATSQELVLYMFRALLFKDYKHLQSQVVFYKELPDGSRKLIEFDSRMRTADDNYPYSWYDHCLCILLGATDE